MPASANEQIADAVTTHSLNLLRVEAQLRNEVLAELNKLQADLTAELASMPLPPSSASAQAKQIRLQRLLKQTQGTITETYKVLAKHTGKSLAQIVSNTQAQTNQAVNNTFQVEVMTTAMTAKQMESLVSGILIHGKHQQEWWAKQSADLRDAFQTAMRDGISRGEGIDDLVKRVRGRKETGYTDGIMNIKKRNAEALVRTSVQAAANHARIQSFLANPDVIKAIQWRSTLDARTTVICVGLDGKQWTIPGFTPIGHDIVFPGPIAHWGCRSTQTPITKSWDELSGDKAVKPPNKPATDIKDLLAKKLAEDGVSAKDISAMLKDKRVTFTGDGPQVESFDSFLKRQGEDYQNRALGVQRAQMWREGKISLGNLIDQRQRPLTISELNKLVQDNQALPFKPAKEGENGLGLMERRLLEESLLYGQQKQGIQTHFVDVATGERLSITGTTPTTDEIQRTATFTKLAVLRNSRGVQSFFGPQELGLFGKLPNFTTAKMVTPDGRVTTLRVKAGRTFGPNEAAALNTSLASKKHPSVIAGAIRKQGVMSVSRTAGSVIVPPQQKKADASLLAKPASTAPLSVHQSAAGAIKDAKVKTERGYAEALFSNAQVAEKELTPLIGTLGGTPVGLQYAVKSVDSMARKIEADVAEKAITPEAAALGITDSVRYTLTFPVETYARDAQAALDKLQAQGYNVERVKNFWGGSLYRGVNAVFQSKSGLRIELQLHTPVSWSIKEKESHVPYERYRQIKGETPEKTELRSKLEGIWAYKIMPVGATAVRKPNTVIDTTATITKANVMDYRGDFDAARLRKVASNGLAAFDLKTSPKLVPIESLISHKNELLDPKFVAGAKNDPRQRAADAMVEAITASGKPRAPLTVKDNGNGTFTIVDGNATAQAAMIAGIKLVPVTVTTPLTVALEQVEAEHIKNSFETGHIFSQDGKLLVKRSGEKSYIQWTHEEASQAEDAILTHNHPRGSSLSGADVNFFLIHNLKEIRAYGINEAGEANLFRLVRKGDGWGANRPKTFGEYQRALEDLKQDIGADMMLDWALSSPAEQAINYRKTEGRIWAEMMKRYPELQYERIELKPA